MKFQDLDLSKRYTYADYLQWRFEETVELIKGKIFKMSPAPNRYHQEISIKLASRIEYFVRKNQCKVYNAPFDVRLPLPPEQRTDDKVDTVVQPDICVICDESKLDRRGCLGAPDWIIEILSPSTAQKDIKHKFEIYEASGVREYWLVYPLEQHVNVYTLNENGKYEGHQPYAKDDQISPKTFPDLVINLSEVFPDIDLAEEDYPEYVVRL